VPGMPLLQEVCLAWCFHHSRQAMVRMPTWAKRTKNINP